ncbi:MAG: DUF2142 domain-containing protein [Saccharofermentans sp.]|nr:DUF2142 domain-containing protein [Saccharofermentans sp.]
MQNSGLVSYLRKPVRAFAASLLLAGITLALMLILMPRFPKSTAVYAVNRAIGDVVVKGGESLEVEFTPFTDFDSIALALDADSPQKEYVTDITCTGDTYVLKITNPGTEDLMITTQVPGCYPGIESLEDGQKLNFGIYKEGSSGAKVYPVIVLFTCAFVFITSYLAFTGKLTAANFYLTGAVTLGLAVFPLLYPAWTTHDADAHYQAAYRFSNLFLGKGLEYTGRACDNEFFSLAWKRFILDGGFRPDPSNEMLYPVTANLKDVFASGEELAITGSEFGLYERMVFYNILNYLPSSLGIAFARLINLTPIYQISMGRLFEGIVVTVFTYIAIKSCKSKTVSFALAVMNLFPMSLIFITAYSYDGIVLMVVTCCIASVMNMLESDGDIKRSEIIWAIVWFFLLGAVKGGGYLMFLPLVSVLAKRPLKSKQNLIPVILIAASLVSVLLFDVVLKPDTGFFQLGGEEGHFEASFALYHPLKYTFLCISTLLAFAGEMFADSIGRCEGWNEEALPYWIVIVIAIAGLALILTCARNFKLTKKTGIAFILCCALLLFLTPVMLLKDTPTDYTLIMGVQGRYFRPMAAFVMLLMAGLRDKIEQKTGKTPVLSPAKEQTLCLISEITFILASAIVILMLSDRYLAR